MRYQFKTAMQVTGRTLVGVQERIGRTGEIHGTRRKREVEQMSIIGAKRCMRYVALVAVVLGSTGAQAIGRQNHLVLSMFGEPQVKDDLFAGADKFSSGAKSTTEVNLDRRMLAMAAKFARFRF